MSIHIRSIVRSAAVSIMLLAALSFTGLALTACEKFKGAEGDRGNTGAQGEAGPQGDAGDTGTQGDTGPQGDVGQQGDTGSQGDPGVDGTATVIIYFELGQTFSLSEDATAGDSAGMITAFTSNGAAVAFAEADPLSTAFDVSSTGEITLADNVTLDLETQDEYVIAVVATATDAPDAHFSVRIGVIDLEQDGTAASPWEVASLVQLQSIATGFRNPHIFVNCPDIAGCADGKLSAAASLAAHYRQTADIDAFPTADATYDSATGAIGGSTSDSTVGNGFLPIGTFGGSYDGGGYLISGLFIDRNDTDNMGLFSRTSDGSVLENVVLVGTDVNGKDSSGVLVGSAAGTVRGSFTSGRLKGGQQIGGLVGESTSAVEDSFSAVTTAGSASIGGLVGGSAGSVRRSFALGSASISGNFGGGLVGASTGAISHSFATGSVSKTSEGGLVGALSGGSASDSYALDTIAPKKLVGSGSADRSYRLVTSTSATAGEVTLAELKALACADAIFEDGDGNTCDASNEDVFPWDFGTDDDLPVINGLVGGLDAQGQRLAVEFSMVDRATVSETLTSGENSVDVTLTAPTVGREAGSVLSYFWVLERSTAISADGLRAREIVITAEAGSYAAHLTIVERDAAGTLLAVYADEFSLTVN